MAVSTLNAYVQYNGNGATTDFAVTFQFFAGADLLVTHIDDDGAETVWSLGTQYTVEGGAVEDDEVTPTTIPAIGTVVVGAAYVPATGEALRIERATAVDQDTVHSNNDAFPAKTVEGRYDYLTLLTQEVRLLASRGLRLPMLDYVDGADPVLPALSAGGILRVNDDGDGFEWVSSIDIEPSDASAFIQTLLDDANAAAARTTLGVYSTTQVDSILTAGYQPLDSDLTAIAALTTTSFGRGLLESANAAALRTSADVYSQAEVDALVGSNFDLDVAGTGRFGLDEAAAGMMIYDLVSAGDGISGAALRTQINYNYVGGTASYVVSNNYVLSDVAAGVTNAVFSFLSVLNNEATAGENVAGYFQGNKNGTGDTWGLVAEADDTTEVADPAGAIYAAEFDISANDTDSNGVRRGVDLIFWLSNVSGADAEFEYGYRISPSDRDTGSVYMSKAFAIEGTDVPAGHTATFGLGFDFSGATYEQGAIKLGDDANIVADTAGAVNWRYDATAGRSMIVHNTAAGNATIYPLALRHTANSTFAAGQGVGLLFDLETADANFENAGFIAVIASDVTATSEDSVMEFGLQSAGAAVGTVMQLSATSLTSMVTGIVALGSSSKGWGSMYLAEVAAPGTPSSGHGVFYVKTDGLPYFKDDAGTETPLGTTGSGGSDTEIQYNASGSLDGISTFTTDGTNVTLTGGLLTLSLAGLPLHVTNSSNATSNQLARWAGNNATRADNDEIYHSWMLADSAGNATEFARQKAVAVTVANGTEEGAFGWLVMKAGVLTTTLGLTSAALRPSTNDGLSLGTSALNWSDLFLASGGVINFNAGDVLLTHSADTLTGSGGALVWTLGADATTPAGRFVNTTDNASVMALRIEGDRATPTANDIVYASFYLSDSGGTQTEFARISGNATTVTDASEAGRLVFAVATAGALASEVEITGTALSPFTTDGNALGTTAKMWSDLFLADGGVVNFNNGNVILTHSAATLTLGGATSFVASGATGGFGTSGTDVIVGHGNTAKIRIDGTDASLSAGLVEIFETGGSLFLSARTSVGIYLDNDGNTTAAAFTIGTNASNSNLFGVFETANVKIAGTATRGTTEGTNHIDIFNGTAPVGTLTNGISLYSESGSFRVMDAAGAVTLISGVYTPTLTNTTNVGASTPFECQYIRIGNVVTVSGIANIDPTAGAPTDTVMGISLPIASNFGASSDCAGVIHAGVTAEGGSITGDTTNDRATATFIATNTTDHTFAFTFTYQVI
jgi:hypothetical protein